MRTTGIFLLLFAAVGAALAAAAPASAGGYHLEYRFNGAGDGSAPRSNLVKLGAELYGTTYAGGDHGAGTIFSFDPATGAATKLYSFQGGADGAAPSNTVIKVGTKLYGTTEHGGGAGCERGCGTVFSFDPATGVETVVFTFVAGSDSEFPYGLTHIGDILYGVTSAYNYGSVYSIDLTSGVEKTVYQFKGGLDGEYPMGLIEAGGMLYGTTNNGGSTKCRKVGCGTVFRVDPATGEEKILHTFRPGMDGRLPSAPGKLIEVGGILYGTTAEGGGGGAGVEHGGGTVFSVDPATGVETVAHAFQGGADGLAPGGALVAIGDTLYGATFSGGEGVDPSCGQFGCGTVYSLNLTTGVEQTIHTFRGHGAHYPQAGLTYADHRLFGTTVYGGKAADCPSEGCGALFSIRP